MITSIIILSILCLFQFIDNIFLRDKIKKLKIEVVNSKNIEKKAKQLEDSIMEITNSDKVMFEYSLKHTPTGKNFEVVYEANVIEVCDKMVKIEAYDMSEKTTIPSEITNNSNYKKALCEYISGKWIDKKSISIIRDQDDIRDHKINKILN